MAELINVQFKQIQAVCHPLPGHRELTRVVLYGIDQLGRCWENVNQRGWELFMERYKK